MNREWNQIEVSRPLSIPFEWRDLISGGDNLGRAEFQACVKFRRGKLSEYWVYPIQTRLIDCWHWQGEYPDFGITSYEGLESSGAWLIYYCKGHKTTSFSVYAPTDAKFILLDCHGISFTKTNWGEL